MAKVARITTPLVEVLHKSQLQESTQADAWNSATAAARDKALLKYAAVKAIFDERDLNGHRSISSAVDTLLGRAKRRPNINSPLMAGKKKVAGRASLLLWVKHYNQDGLEGLLAKYKGSAAKTYSWEHRALALYQNPTQRNMTRISDILIQEGHASAEPHRVRAYFNRLPSSMTTFSPKRVGKHYHQQNIGAYVSRDMSNLPVGHTYMTDGHLCDVYVANPSNGQPWRPELTVWLDWRSKMVVGWGISNAESAISTLHSLSATIDKHKHVPAIIYCDPGSGFKNKMITDGTDSFCERLGITPMFALPGNAKGKGMVEVWFRWFEERCGTDFPTYTFKNRTDDQLRALTNKVKRGDITLPTLAQYKDAIGRYVEWYNNLVRRELKCSPLQMWQTLEPVAPELSLEQLQRPRFTRTVRRHRIEYECRVYENSALQHFHRQDVRIEIDLNDDDSITVMDSEDRFICEAKLMERKHGLSNSFIEDTNQKRLKGRIKRLEHHRDKAIQESRVPIDADENAIDMESIVANKNNGIEQQDPDSISTTETIIISPEDLFL